MLKRHYDYSKSNADNFHPTKEAEDSSHAMPGYPNVYIVDVIPAVLPPPPPIVDPTHNKTITPVKNTTTPIEPATNNTTSNTTVPTNTTSNTTVPTNTTSNTTVPTNTTSNTTVPTNTTSNTTVPTNKTSNTTVPIVKPTHNPSKFIPNDHAGPQNNAAESRVPVPVKKPVKKSDHTMVYLISGIGALIFVILVGLCLCKRNGAASHSHRQIDQQAAGEHAPLKENAYNLNGGSMNV